MDSRGEIVGVSRGERGGTVELRDKGRVLVALVVKHLIITNNIFLPKQLYNQNMRIDRHYLSYFEAFVC